MKIDNKKEFNFSKIFEKFVADKDEDYKQYLRDLVLYCDVYEDDIIRDSIKIKWTTGGIAGGNCWSAGGHYGVDGEPEPEFDILDKIVEHFIPDVSFMNYKRIMKKCLIKSEGTDREYYGNYTNYLEKKFDFEKFFEYVKAR